MEQALLAPPHDDILLGQIGGHTERYRVGPDERVPRLSQELPATGDRPVYDMRHISNRQQRNLRTIERTATCGRARLRTCAAGF